MKILQKAGRKMPPKASKASKASGERWEFGRFVRAALPRVVSRSVRVLLRSNIFLLLAASLLFALSFPNSFFSALPDSWSDTWQEGVPLLVFFFAIPLLAVLLRLQSLREAIFYGAFYGYSSYLLLSLWLLNYDWIAFILVPAIYLYYFSLFFSAFYLCRKHLFRHLWLRSTRQCSYALFVLFWLLLEYAKSTGWVAYTYGSLLYSHYQQVAAIQFSASFWRQNLAYILILLPSICLYAGMAPGIAAAGRRGTLRNAFSNPLWPFRRRQLWNICRLAFWVLAAAAAIALLRHNFFVRLHLAEMPPDQPLKEQTLKVALIQHNINSWQTQSNTDRQALDSLIALSTEAEDQGAELVIWSETAFVPNYRYNLAQEPEPLAASIRRLKETLLGADRKRREILQGQLSRYQNRYQSVALTHRLQAYLRSAKASYIIGSNDWGLPEQFPGEKTWSLYNTLLLIKDGEILDTYHKRHLVPFTEEAKWEQTFPFTKLIPYLQQQGFAQYSAGATDPILELPLEGKRQSRLRLYAMICYEDSLPLYWPQGPKDLWSGEGLDFDVLLSASNDSWSPSPVGGQQHLSSSLSRAVETGRYFFRVSTSGQSVVIGPQGRILERLAPNTPGLLLFSLPLGGLGQ